MTTSESSTPKDSTTQIVKHRAKRTLFVQSPVNPKNFLPNFFLSIHFFDSVQKKKETPGSENRTLS